MGNTSSCTTSIISSGAVKVLLNDGRMEEYTRPIKAGELMIENPRQFVCDAANLHVGHRIAGLAADEELERRRIYFLLPMDLLYSVLTEEEMVSFSSKASSATKSAGPKKIGRIFPVFVDFCMSPLEVKKLTEPIRDLKSTERISRQRSWIPKLDTIEESPCVVG